MKLRKVVYLCGIVFLLHALTGKVSAAATTTVVDGKIARDHLKRHVHFLLYQERYDDLEKMANEFRKTKTRLPEGAWKLSFFYKVFN